MLVLWGPPAPLTHVGCQGNGPLDQVGAGLLGSGSPHRAAVHGDPPLPQHKLSVHGRPWRGPGHRGRGRGRRGHLGDAASTGVSEAVRGPHQGRGWGTPSFLSRPPGALCCLSLEPPALNPHWGPPSVSVGGGGFRSEVNPHFGPLSPMTMAVGGGLAHPDGLPRARGRAGPQAVAPGAISLRRPQSDPPARHRPCCWGALTLRRPRWGSVRSSQGAPAPPNPPVPRRVATSLSGGSILSCARRGGRPAVTTRDLPWPVEGAELGLGSTISGSLEGSWSPVTTGLRPAGPPNPLV